MTLGPSLAKLAPEAKCSCASAPSSPPCLSRQPREEHRASEHSGLSCCCGRLTWTWVGILASLSQSLVFLICKTGTVVRDSRLGLEVCLQLAGSCHPLLSSHLVLSVGLSWSLLWLGCSGQWCYPAVIPGSTCGSASGQVLGWSLPCQPHLDATSVPSRWLGGRAGSVKGSALTVRLLPRGWPGLTGRLVAEVKGPDCLKLSPVYQQPNTCMSCFEKQAWGEGRCDRKHQVSRLKDRDFPGGGPHGCHRQGQGPCWEHLGVPSKTNPDGSGRVFHRVLSPPAAEP